MSATRFARRRLIVALRRFAPRLLTPYRFGSIFRARHQPSLLSQSLKRYSDLYMSSVVDLLDYSPEHRFYPASINSLNPHENKPSVRSKIDRIVMLGTGGGNDDDEDEDNEDNNSN